MARRSNLGIFHARTDEVPGSVQLLGKENKPLGLDPERTPSPTHPSEIQLPESTDQSGNQRSSSKGKEPEQKRTSDGKIILDPQPHDSKNDPLNWPVWRRELALLSIGWHSLIGGGMTPVLAAGFNDVAQDYGVSLPAVALTTGLYMLGLGLGSVIASPLAILYGKRPVYLGGAVLFCLSSVWCALSPTYISLVIARIVQGLAVSPCECLPSATIAEIFFLHERAYRVGIYTLLLLGGKNLVPLVSGVIIQAAGWRWVFWTVSIIVGCNTFLLFLFVPETWWDRTPRPKPERPSLMHRISGMTRSSVHLHWHSRSSMHEKSKASLAQPKHTVDADGKAPEEPQSPRPDASRSNSAKKHAHFAEKGTVSNEAALMRPAQPLSKADEQTPHDVEKGYTASETTANDSSHQVIGAQPSSSDPEKATEAEKSRPPLSPAPSEPRMATLSQLPGHDPNHPDHHSPPKSFKEQLKLFNGRLRKDSFFKAMLRPFVLYAYPAVMWSAVVYALSVGWLIVLSESVAHIYQEQPYGFNRLGTGLVYLSPFIGGILGTIVAGKLSDIIVRSMAKKNDGVYEPEFRLVMGLPIMITTAIGLMGFGWSAEKHDHWMVPTFFFGVISFGCSLGSTTAITFCVDSYRQYAAEALVTLNFTKNVLHGFVFSLFFNHWLEHDGSRKVFLAIGGMQIAFLCFSLPLYLYGKRFRLWTKEKNLMAKL